MIRTMSVRDTPERSDGEIPDDIVGEGIHSLRERVEAYEDLIDSEVGDTTLARSRNLEREHGGVVSEPAGRGGD